MLNDFGENKVVALLGGLHLEMVVLKVLGNWFKDSGWKEAIRHAKLARFRNIRITSPHKPCDKD